MDEELFEKLTKFFSNYRLQTYKKGAIITNPGDRFYEASFIKSGYTRLYVTSKDGREITIGNFKPTFFISVLYSINKKECPFYQECVSEINLWKAPYTEFREYLEKNADVSLKLSEYIAHITESLFYDIIYTRTGNAETKIAGILYSLANTFGNKRESTISIDFETPHRLIATLTGLTRETISFQMKKFERKGLIENQNGILVVKDIAALKKLSQIY
jgi:CRP/FNR family transcriptional regulator